MAAINSARLGAGLPPLLWNSVLERAGDLFCRVAARENVSGHVADDGVPPYLRYALLGGGGYHRENMGSYDSSVALRPEEVPEIVVHLVMEMLAESPPTDGHRQTILDPNATHVGIGVAVDGGHLRTSHEIATLAAAAWSPPPVTSLPLKMLTVGGRLAAPWKPAAVELRWEPLPLPRPAASMPVRAYRYPPTRAVYHEHQREPGVIGRGTGERLGVESDGRFRLTWKAGADPGVEIVIVWARRSPREPTLTAVASAATVVTEDGRLPGNLLRWVAPP